MYKSIILFFSLFLIHLSSYSQSNKPLFSFGLIADIQYCDCDSLDTRFYRNSPLKLDTCLMASAEENLSFMVSLGDLIDRDFRSFDAIVPKIEATNLKMHYVLGNHEFSVEDNEKAKVTERLGIEDRYYDFGQDKWRFIVTDGNDMSTYAWEEDSKNHKKSEKLLAKLEADSLPQAKKWNGAMGKKQIKWLKGVLEMAEENKEKVVLFSHFPIYPADEMHNLWNAREIVEILESHPSVVAWINGHNHAGEYEMRNGIHYFTMRGMVETPWDNSYGIVDVYANRLVFKGVGRESYRVFKVEKKIGGK